jgi:alpha,alpha-trehalase
LGKISLIGKVNNAQKFDMVLTLYTTQMEQDIAFFAKLIGESTTSEIFSEASKARHNAIDSVLWNADMEQWLDYWLPTDGNCQVFPIDIC